MPDKTNPNDPYASVKYAIRGAESSHQFFKDGKLIKNPNSSAKGPYQFTNGTWSMVNNVARSKYGRVLNQNNPQDHELAVSILLDQNSAALRNSGLPVNPGTLYLMHFKGDPNFVRQAINNPNTPISNIFSSEEIKANRSILAGKTVGQAAQTLIGKVMKNMPQNQGRNQLKQRNTMASLTGPKNPNFNTAQAMPKAQRDRIIQEYKAEVRRMKSLPNGQDMINQYNKQMYDLGYIGFNEDGSAKGFIAEGVRNQMTANQKKADDLNKAKRIALRSVGELMRDGLAQSNEGIIRIDSDVAKEKLNSAINKIGKEFPKEITVRKELKDLYDSIPKDNSQQEITLKSFTDTALGREKPKTKRINPMPFYRKIENFYSKNTGQKVDFFKELKINTGEGPGKYFVQPTNGSDINFDEGTFRFNQNKKNLNVENPVVPGGNVQDIVLPDMNPIWDPIVDDAIPGVDNTWSNIGATGTPVPVVDDLNYLAPEWDNTADKNKQILSQMEAYRQAGRDNAAKAAKDLQNRRQTDDEKSQEDLDIEASENILNLGDVVPEDNGVSADLSTFKSRLPLEKIAMGAMGIALGKDMMEEELPMRDEQINNNLLAYIYEQKRIGDMGMNPADEAAAKQSMADAYQIGIDNLTRNASGNRNLILGNLANLDNINAQNMMQLAMKDVEIKQRASESYGRALEYINNFNAQKEIVNNERKYQRAMEKRAMGGATLAGAFRSMSEAISSYSPPNSSENLFKIQQEVSMFGYSPNVSDDGSGTTWGSRSWYQNKIKTAEEVYNRNQSLLEQFNAETPETRREFFKAHKNSTRGQMLSALNNQYNNVQSQNTDSTTTLVDESGNVLAQENQSSAATVPINVTQVQNADGTTTVATPYSSKSTDGTSGNASVSPDQPTLIMPNKTTMFDRLNQKPIQINTYGTPNGKTLNISTDKTRKPITPENTNDFSNFDSNKAFAGMMGLEETYDQVSDINQYYNDFGNNEEERFGSIQGLINKYS